MAHLSVPRDAFEQFQAALRRESKKLIADCAEFLHVSPSELQKEVQEKLKGQPVHISLLETEEQPGCLAFLKDDRFAYRCRTPCVTNTSFCDKHQVLRQCVNTQQAKRLTRLAHKDLPALWLDRETEIVYNVKHQAVGRFDVSLGTLRLYVIQE